MTPAIETYGLTKVYRTRWGRRSIHAVDGISLRVERGTSFGLLGPNGAGKTTFVKLLLSVVHPTAGRAEVFGRDVRIPEARRSVGYLPENHRFPGYLTGAGMLDFFGALSGMDARDRKRRIPELLELVGLSQWGDVRLKKYSKGMLQRLGLAQALLHEPQLLILDEPTDGVDPVGRIQIREILRALEDKGVTIFLNSHMLSEVELFCREVAILHQGRVALTGQVKELTAGSGYKLTTPAAPERLVGELRTKAVSFAASNGHFEFQFADRQTLNEAVDRLRAERCEIESIVRSTSTLEQIFVRTIQGEREEL